MARGRKRVHVGFWYDEKVGCVLVICGEKRHVFGQDLVMCGVGWCLAVCLVI